MASCAEVAAVTVWPAASRIAHFRVTTWGSSSMQRMRAIFVAHLGPCGPAYSWHQYCFAIQGIVKPPDNISPDTYLDAPIESHAGQYLHALQSCWPELQPKRKAEALAPALSFPGFLDDFLTDRLALRKQQQVIRTAGLRIRSRHIEAAERMRTDNRARAFAIDVQVSYVEVLHGALDLIRVKRERRAR